MERKVFDRMAELDANHWWFTARRRILAEVIARIVRLPANARILELGAGTGHNLAMLGRFGRVEATELDPGGRALATERLGRPVIETALPDLSAFNDGAYDLIALLDVLEHVVEDAASLKSIRAKLKPGAALLLTVPINPWMWSAHDVAHHHHRRYRPRDIRAMAEAAGYSVQLLSPFNSLLFPLIAAARVAGKASGRESADDAMPGALVNRILGTIFGAERWLIGRLPLPVGVSLLAVLRRPA